ncbi:MAG: cysteine--tRNA ligase [Pseudomonadota bacterium]
MTEIKLTNTATRRKEIFRPIDASNVRMYVCGPTVYDRAHLGNARPAVVFDVLFRLLRHVYGPGHVTYVRNYTDIDDKILARARETGRDIGDITTETIGWYEDDMITGLGALRPTHQPRATDYVPQMVAMIEDLINGGYAYVVRDQSNNPPQAYVLADRERLLEAHALFEVDKYERYGELSGRSINDMIAGARVEVAPYKRNPMDFVLWKPSSRGEHDWDGPVVAGESVGRGRPGWHIECSAMAKALLGDTFDIHCGGMDLQFPHHENEIAQSCCANGTEYMARYWLHNEMLQVEGKKMSKSLGNFFTVRDLLDQGIPGEVIRFVLLSTHYRKPMDWTAEKAQHAHDTLSRWSALVHQRPAVMSAANVPSPVDSILLEHLGNDLNTAAAIARLHELFTQGQRPDNEGNQALGALYHGLSELLGLDLRSFHDNTAMPTNEQLLERTELNARYDEIVATQIDALIARRTREKQRKNYEEADRIRKSLLTAGVTVKDTPDGPTWSLSPDFDFSRLEALE